MKLDIFISGIPEDKIAAIVSEKPSFKIVQNGDSYTVTSTGSGGEKNTTFTSGVEIDDTIGNDNTPVSFTN